MKIKTPVSLKEVKSGFEPLPADSYRVRVNTVTYVPTSKSGNPYLKFEFEVTEGDYAGRKLWSNTSLQAQAIWKLRKTIEALGATYDDTEFETEDLIGREAIATVTIDESFEKPQNVVEDLIAA